MTTAQEYLNSGNYYRELKNYDKAINNYKKALDVLDKEIKSPKNSSMIKGIKFNITGVLVEIRDICDEHYNTAGVYMREKDWYSAIDELDMAIEEYSAINCIKEEDYFEEIDKESRGWKISILDNFAFAYDNRASCYEELGEYQKALSDMNKVIGLCPNEGYFYINRGQVLSKMEEYERAVEDYTQAIDLCSKDDSIDWSGNRRKDLIMAYVNRAYNYTNLNKYTDAVYDCTKAIELDPDNIRNHGFRAHCYQKLQQYGKAIEGYSKVIDMCDEEDNYCFNAYRDRIDCYIEIRDYNSAKTDCEYLLDNKAIFLPYAEYDTYSNIESVYHQLKQVTENENYDYDDYDDEDDNYNYDYDEENDEDSDEFNSLCASEDFDKGIEIYTSKIKSNPDNAKYYLCRGFFYNRLEQYNNAIDDFSKVIELCPNMAGAYNHRGFCYRLMAGFQKILTGMQNLLDSIDNISPVKSEIHKTDEFIENINKAIADYTKAIELEPDYYSHHKDRGDCYELNDEYDLAITDYKRAIELSDDDSEIKEIEEKIEELTQKLNMKNKGINKSAIHSNPKQGRKLDM